MIFFELFYTFFLIGLFTFGGGYAMIPMITEQILAHSWMSLESLTDFIAISEMTPGSFAINIATFIGSEVGGVFGSVCATLGVVLPSFIIIIIVAIIMNKFLKNKYVQAGLKGTAPVVLSLLLSTSILMFLRVIFFGGTSNYQDFSFDRASFSLFIILSSFFFIANKINKKSVGPIKLLILSAFFGIIIFF